MNKSKTRCTFAGHSKIHNQNLVETIKNKAKELIAEYGVNEFWVGHYGDFDHYAAKAVRELKQEHNAELVLVIPYLTKELDEYKEDYYKNFDAIIMADIPEKTPTKLSIIKANQYMVNESDYLICYVKNSWGGATKTLEYAKKRNIEIFNLVTVIQSD